MRDDAAQREARRVEFSFPTLRQKAIESCPGAKAVLRYDKLEGNFNRAFIFHMDNGIKVVARIPFSVAGPPSLVTSSEVATLAYSGSVPSPTPGGVLTHIGSPGPHLSACSEGAGLERRSWQSNGYRVHHHGARTRHSALSLLA